jgi:hypothetical protein
MKLAKPPRRLLPNHHHQLVAALSTPLIGPLFSVCHVSALAKSAALLAVDARALVTIIVAAGH